MENWPRHVVMKLRFNPMAERELREIFTQPFFRTLYLVYRRNHIVDPHFPGRLLKAGARLLEITGNRPITVQDIEKATRSLSGNGCGSESHTEWCREAIHYLTGHKTITWEQSNPIQDVLT